MSQPARANTTGAPLLGLVLVCLLSGCSGESDLPPEFLEKLDAYREAKAAVPDERTQPISRFVTPPSRAIEPVQQWTLGELAAEAVGRIGPAAVPGLVGELQSRDPAQRRRAAEVLGRIGPDAEPAVAALTVAIDDPDPGVRRAAVFALGQIGPAASPAVPRLLRAFHEPPR